MLWFVPFPDQPDWMLVHGIGNPVARRRGPVFTPYVVTAIEVLGGYFGATRIYSPLPTIPELAQNAHLFPIKAMRRYLRMRGWHGEDGIGPYLDLK